MVQNGPLAEMSPYPMQVNVRLLLSTSFHTVYHYLVVLGSIALYYIYILVYCYLPPHAVKPITKQHPVYFVIYEEVAPNSSLIPLASRFLQRLWSRNKCTRAVEGGRLGRVHLCGSLGRPPMAKSRASCRQALFGHGECKVKEGQCQDGRSPLTKRSCAQLDDH